MTTALAPKELQEKVIPIVDAAKTLAIRNNDTYVEATSLLTAIKTMRREIANTFDPIIAKQFAAHREACEQKRRHESPLIEAENLLKRGIVGFQKERERIRRQEERRLQEIARKAEEDRKLAEAKAAEDAGDHKTANEIINETPAVPPVILTSPVPKVSGVVTKENWNFRIVDVKAIPHEYMIPDLVKIRQVVKAFKGDIKIPGVEIFSEKVISAKPTTEV